MTYGSVVDQQAGKPQDLDSSSLSNSTSLMVVIAFIVCSAAIALAADKRRWILPAIFVCVFIVWPIYGVLTH